MPIYDRKKVLANECPYCKAAPGERCRKRGGGVAGEEHTLRKGLVYESFLSRPGGEKKPGVPKPPLTLSDGQKRTLLGVASAKMGVILRFEGTRVDYWRHAIECIDDGLAEIFIDEDRGTDRKGEACVRMRLTAKGRRTLAFIKD